MGKRKTIEDLFKGRHFEREIIEELMASRGIFVAYESIRQWTLKFGQTYANALRRRQPNNWLRVISVAEFVWNPQPAYVCSTILNGVKIRSLWQLIWRRASTGNGFRRI